MLPARDRSRRARPTLCGHLRCGTSSGRPVGTSICLHTAGFVPLTAAQNRWGLGGDWRATGARSMSTAPSRAHGLGPSRSAPRMAAGATLTPIESRGHPQRRRVEAGRGGSDARRRRRCGASASRGEPWRASARSHAGGNTASRRRPKLGRVCHPLRVRGIGRQGRDGACRTPVRLD